MIEARIEPTFASWRDAARTALRAAITPDQLLWSSGDDALPALATPLDKAAINNASAAPAVPRAFLSLAETVAMHRDRQRWAVLYRVLFRIVNRQHDLLENPADDDVLQLRAMEKSVHRDEHKMHAFVRFRKVTTEAGDHYIAFHRPDHLILPATAPWFARRFPTMRWTILTPDASATWDGRSIAYGPGVARSPVQADELEELWRVYYRNIFNPARVKIGAMKKEMPTRHWATLPETQEIDPLLLAAPQRVAGMIRHTAGSPAAAHSAAEFVPQSRELRILQESAPACRGCDLYCHATQVVFGRGPADALAMFVGEQPGDQEDLAGLPFVGPAGKVLDEALAEVGIDRQRCYVTNAVKHFKFEQRGKRRIHSKPSAREMGACRPWLEAEVEALRPPMIIALGATAAQSMLGPAFRLTPNRGRVLTDTKWSGWWMATLHPSALLRIPDPALQAQAKADFISDLRLAAEQWKALRAGQSQ